MPLKLENVRLTPYPELTAIPAGFKIAGEFKTRRGPSPMQYNWYSRHDSVQHEVFHLLAMAPTEHPTGYTVDELKGLYTDDSDKAKVDEIINKFKGSWDHRHTGFDLVVDEATGTRYMLIWRDPRTNYAKEIGLEGDHSTVQHQKTPSYVEKVPQLIEEAKNPKPVAEKPAKAEGAPKAPRAPKAKPAEAATAPSGGFLTAFAGVVVALEGTEGGTISAILETAITKLVDPNAMQIAPDDVNVKVVDRLHQVIDQHGLEGATFVDYVAKYQKEGAIKAGFYKICKDLSKKWAEAAKSAAATPVAPPVAATAEQPAPAAQ